MLAECNSSSSEGEEEEEEEDSYLCLFCDVTLPTSHLLLSHSLHSHEVDLVKVLAPRPFHDVIKLLNYVRREGVPPQEFQSVEAGGLGEGYLKPVLSNDSLLMIDYAELGGLGDVTQHVTGGRCDVTNSHHDTELELLRAKLGEMQVAYLALLDTHTQTHTQTHTTSSDRYFASYSDYTIHAEMLQDTVRTSAYRDYVYNNPALFEGRDVLDVGCGTGILSLFCARGGARRVTAVDNSEIAGKAVEIVRRNGLCGVIQVIRGQVEEVRLEHKVDVLISEWMGYGLLFECMLDSVIVARDAHLAPGGIMVPAKAALFLAGVSDMAGYDWRFRYWRDVYGFNMEDVIPELYRAAVVEAVEEADLIAPSAAFKHLDLAAVSAAELEFTARFELEAARGGPLTALCLHFSCYFEGEASVVLDTSPLAPTTHWLHTVLYLREVVPVEEGDLVTGDIEFVKCGKMKRGYVIRVNGSVRRAGTHLADIVQTFLLN